MQIIRNALLVCIYLIAACLYPQQGLSQDIRYAELNSAALALNPAFTGMFNGDARISGLFAHEWTALGTTAVTYGMTFDAPIFTSKNGDYLAAGLRLMNLLPGEEIESWSDDACQYNLSGTASVAYHKLFGSSKGKNHKSDLAIGVQGSYSNLYVQAESLHFIPNFPYNSIPQSYYSNYTIERNAVNGGISFSHFASPGFSYTIGLAGYNLNQPKNDAEQQQNTRFGLDRRYIGTLGAEWKVSNRLMLRPEIITQSQDNATNLTIGNEFHYRVKKDRKTSVFAAVWYHNGGIVVVTAGVEYNSLRLAMGYATNLSSFSYNDAGGFAISLKYVVPSSKQMSGNRVVPCSRF